MSDQTFSTINFLRLINIDDFYKYKIPMGSANKTKKLELFDAISQKISSESFKFSNFQQSNISGNKILTTTNITDELAIRKLNDNLKKIYKVKQTDRNTIINQINSLIREEVPMSILRMDISKFYESIDREQILTKIKKDNLLSYRSILLLEQLYQLPEFAKIKGLHRGISISATFSELFMRQFDSKIKLIHGIYYYARFVDDIIVFVFDNLDEVIEKIKHFLPNGLKFNSNKFNITHKIKCNCKPSCTCTRNPCQCKYRCQCSKQNPIFEKFEYLGYKFEFEKIAKEKNKVKISLADSKVKKIKSRIIYSFLDYLKNKNFDLLEKRIKFITGNYTVKKQDEGGMLNAGIYYN